MMNDQPNQLQTKVLSGELIHTATRELDARLPMWSQMGEMHQIRSNDIAHILCEYVSLCEGCGQQRHTHTLAGMQFCLECVSVQEERLGERAVCTHPEYHQATLSPSSYQRMAERTIYPDLTMNERLSLCGLGLAGEGGEVCDLLKKYLHHRNGKPLDIVKLTEELGDVLWYFAVLCSTLGITIEEVMQANLAKMQRRHPNGFQAHYASDSGASEPCGPEEGVCSSCKMVVDGNSLRMHVCPSKEGGRA